jgi:hypothetical protein
MAVVGCKDIPEHGGVDKNVFVGEALCMTLLFAECVDPPVVAAEESGGDVVVIGRVDFCPAGTDDKGPTGHDCCDEVCDDIIEGVLLFRR